MYDRSPVPKARPAPHASTLVANRLPDPRQGAQDEERRGSGVGHDFGSVAVLGSGAGGGLPPGGGGREPFRGHYSPDVPEFQPLDPRIRMAAPEPTRSNYGQRLNAARLIQQAWRDPAHVRTWGNHGITRRMGDTLREFRRYGTGPSSAVDDSRHVPSVAAPHARITLTKPGGRTAEQNNLYDRDGKLHYQVDFATHGVGRFQAPSGHWHELSERGNPRSGHSATGGNQNHYPPTTAPPGGLATHNGIPHDLPPGYSSRNLPGRGMARQNALRVALGPVAAAQPGATVPEMTGEQRAAYLANPGDATVQAQIQQVRQAYLRGLGTRRPDSGSGREAPERKDEDDSKHA
jgi:hypothetical protein